MPPLLKTIRLQGFRTFRDLTLSPLTRVNLLVGANSAGKTSVLEGAEILLGGGGSQFLARSLVRRNESVAGRDDAQAELDVRHLFHGHALTPGTRFRLDGVNSTALFVECVLVPASDQPPLPGFLPLEPESAEMKPALDLQIKTADPDGGAWVPLSPSGGLTAEARRRYSTTTSQNNAHPVIYVGPEGSTMLRLGSLWDDIVLTPEESRVIESLQVLEPEIERIAATSRGSSRSGGGMLVKLKGSDERLPLGSMGDGIKRLLLLAVSIVTSGAGYLMVDEVDTGLHYSVMVDMWRLLVHSARRLDVQVFATTHSLDCVRALAYLYESAPDIQDDVSVHRVGSGLSHAIRYSAEEIHAAAQQHIEVR